MFSVVKLVLRVARVNGRVFERDVVGAINIGLKYLSSDGSPMALSSAGAETLIRVSWGGWLHGAMLQAPWGLNVDGSAVPLGSTATHEPAGISKSLRTRWKPLEATLK